MGKRKKKKRGSESSHSESLHHNELTSLQSRGLELKRIRRVVNINDMQFGFRTG